MIIHWRRFMAVILMLPVLTALLTGCWDNREINDWFIITGVALDASENPDQVNTTVQIAEIKQEDSGSDKSNSGSNEAMMISTSGHSIMSGLIEINRNSNHKLMMQHNKIRLFGTELAQQGIQKHLDLFMRDQQARLEVPVAVVDGNAGELLAAKIEQDPISGIFLEGMFEDLAQISTHYQVRLIDLVQRLLDETTSPVLPIIKATGGDENKEIKLEGMAVFKGDQMVGRLSNDETLGYIWAMGNVRKCDLEVKDNSNSATLRITKLDCKKKITLRPDGGVRVALSINAMIGVRELYGFKEMKPRELMPYLENLAREEIKKKIAGCFKTAQNLNTDIFGYCNAVYQKYPRYWNENRARKDEIFADIDFSVEVDVRIPATGQIVQSLEMEENTK